MWLISSRHEADNGARLVKYSLLALIVFMLVCTFLAIILVSFVSDYSTVLHDQKQGIILVLVIIAANYLVGLVALWRSNLFLMAAFALMDLFLAVICLLNTQHYHQMGNLTALLLFSVSSFLAVTVVLQTCHQQAIRRTSTIQTANVNCYRHVLDDWYDYNSGGDKDELIVNQLLMPYDCPSDINVDEILSVNPNGSATFCTVETTEEKYLHGNRYAL